MRADIFVELDAKLIKSQIETIFRFLRKMTGNSGLYRKPIWALYCILLFIHFSYNLLDVEYIKCEGKKEKTSMNGN